MTNTFQVLITDYMWPSLDIERNLLSPIGAQLIISKTGEEEELIELAPQADAILTCWKPVTESVLDAAQHCLTVCRYGIGLDNIAVDHATKLGIIVTNVPDYCLDEVSDHAMALLLSCARRVARFAIDTHRGIWDLSLGESMRRLRGQTVGLVGYGKIARSLTPKALAFGLKVIAYDIEFSKRNEIDPSVVLTNKLDDLLRESDYVSLHVPLTDETRGMIDARALKIMKPTAFLINTSRGAVIDEVALYQALTKGWISGAALDVLTHEPPESDNPLLSCNTLIATPHSGFYSIESIEELEYKAASQVSQVLTGKYPKNVVNPNVTNQSNYRLGIKGTDL